MKDFLKMFFAALLALAVVVGGFVAAMFLFVAVVVGGKETPKVAQGSYLVLDLSAPIVDKPSDRSPRDVLQDAAFGGGGRGINLWTLTEAIRRAGDDKRVKGIYLTGTIVRSGWSSGWGALKEIRDNLAAFRAKGKRIVVYSQAYTEESYYLASVADEVVVNPFGGLEFNGFASQPLFYAKAFEKFGVGVQVTRVGKYKSAVEPFILDKMSDANREQIQKLLGDMWDEYLKAVSAARRVPVDQLQRIADTKGMLRGVEMVDAKLADKTAYFDDVLDELRKDTGVTDAAKPFRQITLGEYLKTLSERRRGKGQVAVLYAEGDIVDGGSRVNVGGDYFARLLRRARQDKDVKAVVLRVNSPGGSASASEVIQREVRLLKREKPVIVSMGTVAASGGYWISAYGDKIFAEPATLTGSIGVFGMLPNFEKLMNNVGVGSDVVKTGKYADLGTVYRAKTPEELALIQGEVDWIYGEFISKVAEGRKLPRAKVEEIAQGRVWSGVEAKALGLVDEMGGLEDAIHYAAQSAKLGDNYSLAIYQVKKNPMEQIITSLGEDGEDQTDGDVSIAAPARELLDQARRFSTLNDPRGVYARLPYDLNIH
ncbi:MAG TPA: signal peptide peptidase SppA [Acidobacteriota bacterium]|nr:signal peptide peptidase SppA [Acidobacteriota bacterium]